jgi:hypothetical protein
MYDSFMSAMKHLSDAEFRECMLKISDYALDGVDEESSSPMVNVIMELVKPNLDAANKRYDACVENGKKGAEYGKLGGAPKGNQNARKKQPLKQPLNVDVEENVNNDVNLNEKEKDNVEVNKDADAAGLYTSVSNSIDTSFIDSITLDDSDLEGDMLQSNSSIGVVNTDRNETSSYSKGQSVYSSGSSYSGKAAGSSAARRGDEGMDMSEYMELVIAKNICRLAEMKQQDKELDKNILNGTIDNIIALYGHHDRKSAYRLIMVSIEKMIANNTI